MEFEISQVAEHSNKILNEVETAVVGKSELLKKVLAAVIAGGHILFEDYPGLAKTLIAKSMATALGLQFKRIQFTPDLLPGDITGGYIFDRDTNTFKMRPGPIFANIILADEINRASPKTQSALLEAMQERQVTLEGDTMPLPEPFIVMATQNPIEYEGTFPLPEAQLDRFMVKLSVGYPSVDSEQEILVRRLDRKQDDIEINAVTGLEEMRALKQAVEKVYVHPDLSRYIVNLVNQTRMDGRVSVGSSPRGSLALLKLAMAQAAMDGRDFILPDDIKSFIHPALIHRIILVPDLWMNTAAAVDVLESAVSAVPVPVIS